MREAGLAVRVAVVTTGASCGGNISFTPTSAGNKTATLTVGSATASLTGTGLVGAVTMSPSPLAFGSIAAGLGYRAVFVACALLCAAALVLMYLQRARATVLAGGVPAAAG